MKNIFYCQSPPTNVFETLLCYIDLTIIGSLPDSQQSIETMFFFIFVDSIDWFEDIQNDFGKQNEKPEDYKKCDSVTIVLT